MGLQTHFSHSLARGERDNCGLVRKGQGRTQSHESTIEMILDGTILVLQIEPKWLHNTISHSQWDLHLFCTCTRIYSCIAWIKDAQTFQFQFRKPCIQSANRTLVILLESSGYFRYCRPERPPASATPPRFHAKRGWPRPKAQTAPQQTYWIFNELFNNIAPNLQKTIVTCFFLFCVISALFQFPYFFIYAFFADK